MHSASVNPVWLVYDGACPLCTSFAKAVRIREAVGELHLIDARKPHSIIKEINQRGLNLDEGIVLKYNVHFYHGADALHLLALLGSNYRWFNRLNARLLRSKQLTKFIYPILKCIRNVLLWCNGFPKINNLKKNLPIFHSVFAQEWENLPPVMKKHYSNRPYRGDRVCLEGKVSIQCSKRMNILLPIFRLLNILPAIKGKNIPVQVVLQSYADSPALHFNRVFIFPNRNPVIIQSAMLPIKKNVVVDFFLWNIGWQSAYEVQKNKVRLKHKTYVFNLFGFMLPLPLTLLLGKMVVEKEAISDNEFTIFIQLNHILFGNFNYGGRFAVSNN